MPCNHCPNRRKFIREAAQGALGTLLLGATLPAVGCGKASSSGSSGLSAGPTGSNGVFTFSFANYAALQSTGGCVQVTLSATSGTKAVCVTRVSSSQAAAVSALCTHQSCTVDPYSVSNSSYTCACHGSQFSATGAVLQGPANTPLTSYTATITATGIQVSVS